MRKTNSLLKGILFSGILNIAFTIFKIGHVIEFPPKRGGNFVQTILFYRWTLTVKWTL